MNSLRKLRRIFIRDIIHDRLHAKEVYLGKGFAFGRGRGGNIELLRKMSGELGFTADEVNEVRLRGERISSSKIRELLSHGRVNLVRRMLGRPYGVEGVIVRGDRRGSYDRLSDCKSPSAQSRDTQIWRLLTATLIDGTGVEALLTSASDQHLASTSSHLLNPIF